MGCLNRFMGYLHSHRCGRGRAAFITFYYFLPHWLDPIISWKSDRDSALAYLPKVPSCISTLYSCSVFLLYIPALYFVWGFSACRSDCREKIWTNTLEQHFGEKHWSKTLKRIKRGLDPGMKDCTLKQSSHSVAGPRPVPPRLRPWSFYTSYTTSYGYSSQAT